jgi:hypothetical protein
MAKKNSKGRVRVFFAEIEGDDETIQDGLKAMAVAVGKTFQPKTIVKQIALEADPDEDEDELDDELELDDDVIDATSTRKREKKKSAVKAPKFILLGDLDLKPEGKVNLTDWMASLNASKQYEQVTACVYYLRKTLQLEGLTHDHVYTCLKEVGIPVPKLLPTQLRNIASRQGLLDCSDMKQIDITTAGENLVEHKLISKAEE